jgi:hypothetical protein
LLSIIIAGCGSDHTEQLVGTWKNGDGNLLRFTEDGKAFRGQEGLSGEGASTYVIKDDSIIVTTDPEEDPGSTNTFHLLLAGDTLYLASITLKRPGETKTIPIETFALQTGKSVSKMHFTRIAEKK